MIQVVGKKDMVAMVTVCVTTMRKFKTYEMILEHFLQLQRDVYVIGQTLKYLCTIHVAATYC